MTDDKPTMTVLTDNIEITVNDRRSAEMALDIVDDVLPHYLMESAHVETPPELNRTKYEYDAECPECGYEWRRRAENDRQAVCPECGTTWRHDVRGADRDDAEVV